LKGSPRLISEVGAQYIGKIRTIGINLQGSVFRTPQLICASIQETGIQAETNPIRSSLSKVRYEFGELSFRRSVPFVQSGPERLRFLNPLLFDLRTCRINIGDEGKDKAEGQKSRHEP
jgi:hypothetical protein